MTALLLGLVPVVLLALGFVWVLRARVPRRLALRNARRRPTETALVVSGSLLGAALITGSLIVGDTLDSSIRATARTQLGPVDEIVVVPDQDQASSIRERIEGIDDPRIEDVTSLVAVQAALASDSSSSRRAEPDARLVELDFVEARAWGGDPAATGVSGATPSEGEVAITEDLAETLAVGVGRSVTAYLYGAEVELEVAGVLPRVGLAGFWQGVESTSPNAFVAPGTIEDVTSEGIPKQAIPPSTTILISNRGGIEEGAKLTDEVTSAIDAELGTAGALRVEPVKQERLDSAQAQGDQFSQLFFTIGSFAILAGVLLLINIFVMLSEERKGQLGMLRAIGMRRSDIVRQFILEGTLYALVANALGAVLGIGVGWTIVKLAAPIFGGGGDFSLDLIFALTGESLVSGFAIGLLISLATVIGTSIRISRINIIRAIRDIPEPKLQRTRVRNMVLGALLTTVAVSLFVVGIGNEDAWLVAILGPPLASFGLLPLISRFAGRRRVVLVMAAGALLWGIFGNRLLNGQFFDSGELFAFVIQGVLLTFSAVVLLTQVQENFEGGIRRVAARNLSLRLGLAYPLARRFRTGLTLGMYSLVVFTMVFIAVLSNIFGGQIDRATRQEAGGFDLVATASEANPPTAAELQSVEGVGRVSTQVFGSVLFQPDGFADPVEWTVAGIERSFVDIGPPAVAERAPGLSSDEAMWRELLRDPATVVISPFFLQAGGGPPSVPVEMGDQVAVFDPVSGISTERRVIGMTNDDQAFSGSFMSRGSVEEVLQGRVAPNRFFIAAEGTDAAKDQIATRLQGRFVGNGLEAETFRSIIEESQRLSVQFLQLMQGYLALGLLVGIAGLGVVMVRSVRERRREIGVLRSLGFLSPQVRRAFLLESGFTALEGILVGSILALVTSAQLVANGDFGEGVEFIVPWSNVTVLCIAALGASLLATAWPARQASRIPPAVALRVAE